MGIQYICYIARNEMKQHQIKDWRKKFTYKPTCFSMDKRSECVRLRELVDPIRRDIDPLNLCDSWCWWIAIDKARRCKASSSAAIFRCDLPLLLLFDPISFSSFFDMQINRLPIINQMKPKNTHELLRVIHRKAAGSRSNRGSFQLGRKNDNLDENPMGI